MTVSEKKTEGKVCLVGAGPGDPGLITAAGLDRLRHADVVVYDALANPVLLREAPPTALLIDAGKRAKHHRLTQDQTNDLLVEHARAGRLVVRLKGGDPYLFGRGGEEAVHLGQRGIDIEVIPGVTAGIAAPAAAGIPVTYRGLSSSVTFVTGHEDPTKGEPSVDWSAMAGLIRGGGTCCVYMGVGRLPAIADALVAGGLPADTPAAAVSWGTLPRQRSTRSTLTRLADAMETAGVAAPAIVVIGGVASLDEAGLNHFTRRPLLGQRVLVPRTREQASALRAELEALGAHVIEAPTIRIESPEDWAAVDAAVRAAAEWDWLVLTSTNGVAALADRLEATGLDARSLAGPRIAVVGEATAAALWDRLRLRPDFLPTQGSGAALARELAAAHPLSGQRVLLLRAAAANPDLPRLLRQAGADVTDLAVYRTLPVDQLPVDALAAIESGEVDWIAFTSSSTVRNLVDLLGPRRELLHRIRLASIGPTTSDTLRDLGLPLAAEAPTPSIAALAAALAEAERG